MGWLDFKKQTVIPPVDVIDHMAKYNHSKVGSIEIPDKLTNQNAFILANTVAEIYHPIDFLADRASKLRFYIADKKGVEVENTELNRFINDINPLFGFNELIYQHVFSLLADGNAFSYLGVPSLYKSISVNTINRLDILQPDEVILREYANMSLLNIKSYNDVIVRAQHVKANGFYDDLLVPNLRINTYDATHKELSLILSKSPLFKAYRSINNLLATYSARYNVYVNNGAAGYLAKKSTPGACNLEESINPVDRAMILKDINERNGLTGKRNMWGISSVPIEFINTLVSIQSLMPFEETLEDAIQVSGTYQIPPGLVPRKDQSTYNNQDADEKRVWENTLISLVDMICEQFTKNLTLNKAGYEIKADYSSVSCLQINKKDVEDNHKLRLENLKLIKEIAPEKTNEVTAEIDKILQNYGKD